MYADYAYYVSGYLLGKTPAVPEEEYPFWGKQAAKELDKYTFNRLQADSRLVTDEVKDCACAVAELLYKADMVAQQGLANGVAGALTSYSNDGQSGTVDVSQSVYTETGKRAEIKRLISLYLCNTGLLYAGVRVL